MPQILEGPRFTDLHAFRLTLAEIALDHSLLFGRIEDATVGTGQCAEKTSHALFFVDGDNSCLRIFSNRPRGTDMETVGLAALKADNRAVISLPEMLDRPDSGTADLLRPGLNEGAGLFTVEAIIAFFRIDG
jgi:hypothetical protein